MSKLPKTKNLSIDQAAKYLGVSTKTLRRWETSHKLISQRTAGGHRRYDMEDLQVMKMNTKKKVNYTVQMGVMPIVQGVINHAPTAMPITPIAPVRAIHESPLLPLDPGPLLSASQKKVIKSVGLVFLFTLITLIMSKGPFDFAQGDITNYVNTYRSILANKLPVPGIAKTLIAGYSVGALRATPDSIASLQNDKSKVLAAAINNDAPIFNVNIQSSFKEVAEFLKGINSTDVTTGTLEVTGASSFTGPATFAAGADITGNITTPSTTFNLLNTTATTLNFAGASTATSISATTGTTTINNDLIVKGTLKSTGKLTASGDFDLSGALNVGGATTLSGALSVSGATTLSGAVTMGSTLAVTGAATFGDITEINGVTYSFPTTQGATSSILTDDGSGNLSWGNLGSLSGVLPIISGGTNNSTAYTTGSVIFSDGTKLTQDNTNFFWNDTTNRLGIGTNSPTSTLSVAGTTTLTGTTNLTGSVNLGGANTDQLTFTGRIASGTNLSPLVDLGADLGTASLRYNNIYAANLTIDSGLSSGQLLVTYNPTDTTFGQSSIRINVTTPALNEQMFGVGSAGDERAALDAEGDLSLGYAGSAGSSTPVSQDPLNVYGHNTTRVAYIDTSGNMVLNGTLQTSGSTTISSLNASAGVYTDTNKVLTSTPPTSGVLGYWTRSGTTVSPATSTDNINLTPNVTTGTGTTAGLYIAENSLTSGYGVDLQSSSITTGDLMRINSTGTTLTSGNLLNVLNNGSSVFSVSGTQITNGLPTQFTSAGDVGIAYDLAFTNPVASAIKSSSNLLLQAGETFNSSDLTLQTYNFGSVVIDSVLTSGTGTKYTSYINAGDSTSIANTSYGQYITSALTGNAAKTGIGLYSTVSTSSTTADTIVGGDFATNNTGVITTGTRSNYGLRTQPTSTAASSGGTSNMYGLYSSPSTTLAAGATINMYGGYFGGTATLASGTINSYGVYIANPTMNTTGTSTKYGLYVEDVTASAADTNYAAIFAGGNVGIGTTTPGFPLSVSTTAGSLVGTASFYTPSMSNNQRNYISIGTASTDSNGFYLAYNHNSTAASRYVALQANERSAGANSFVVDALGNVGVGTVTPAGKLDVTEAVNTQPTVSVTNNTATTLGAGINTTGVLDLQSTSLTTGNFMNIETNALTTGKSLNVTSTSTALTTGSLGVFDWSPGSATTATGDLVSLNVGSNGIIGNIFNVKNASSSVFSVSQAQITNALPTAFTSPGDVVDAYDFVFTNPVSSAIKSSAPLYLQAGETFNSSDLTLQTYNFGSTVIDSVLTSGTGTKYTAYVNAGDSTAIANTNYGVYITSALSGAAAKTGTGIYSTVSTSSTTSDTIIGGDFATSATGIIGATTRTNYGLRTQPVSTSANTAGTQNMYGIYSAPSATLAAGSTENVYGGYFGGTATVASGTINRYGIYIDNASMNTTGTSTQYGLYVNTPSGADNNYAAIFAGGNVGIGTATPGDSLDITGGGLKFSTTAKTLDLASGTNGNTFIAKIPQKATTGTCGTGVAEGLIWQNTGGTQVGHACISGPTAGAANKLNFYAEAFNATSTDLAENYSDRTNSLSAGDVVILDPTTNKGVMKATAAYQGTLVGIISDNPGLRLTGVGENGQTDLVNPKAVALQGRVPVKIASNSPAIKLGDFITSSDIAGRAMKATNNGYVIGKALESWDPPTPGATEGKSSIMIFVNLGYYAGDLAMSGNLATNTTNTNTTSTGVARYAPTNITTTTTATDDQIASISAQIKDMGDKITTLENDVTILKNMPIATATDSGKFKDLTVLGNSTLGDTLINGKLNIGSLIFDNINQSVNAIGVLKIQDLALGNIEFMNGLITFDTKGNVIANKVSANKYEVLGESAGTGTIKAGQTSTTIYSNQVTDKSLILVTAKTITNSPLSVTVKTTGVGFKVEITNSTNKDVNFDWFVVDKQ